ncbi:MAG TPA: hypothetical protein VLA76_03800 [Candidatus Angelobacter sp.]|nr:hypothetical protein [Candidatus Angelobacter sp.]
MSHPAVNTPHAPTLDEPRLFRLAGRCLRWATATLAVAGVSIGLFFGGAGAVFGPINDVTTAGTLLLMVPGILAVRQLARGRVGSWFSALTVATVLGLGVAAAGLLLLVARVISLNDSFLIGGIGILPFLAWLASFAFIALRRGVLTRRAGWLAAWTLGIAVAATAASPFMPMNLLVFVLGLPMFGVLAAWLWIFGTDMLEA